MPIYETDMPVETMKKRANTHKCGVCNAQLNVAWGGSFGYNGYILRCGQDIEHDLLTDYKKPSKDYEEGNKLFRRLHGMDTVALMKMDQPTMLARIGQAKFPSDLSTEDKKLMAQVSISYGLDPILNELMIYQGNPYPTINARYRKAQETGKFDGINTRPATPEERKARNCREFDILYCAEVWRTNASHPFVGWGRVRGAERKGSEHLPIVKDADRMAEKRAEAMGLRKAFSMPVPFQSWEEYEEQRAEKAIDKTTGEIIEGAFREVPDAEEKHWCEEHSCGYDLKQGKFGPFYAHKHPEGGWCNESKKKEKPAKTEPKAKAPTDATPETISETVEPADNGIDMVWLEDSLASIRAKKLEAWTDPNILSYLKMTYEVEAGTVLEAVKLLDKGRAAHLVKRIQDTLEML